MNELVWGMIGSGFMGRTFAETVAKYCTKTRLVAVTGGSRAEEVGRDYGIAVEGSVEALVGRKDIQAVFIGTPHHMHKDHAIAAARAGKHIMCEKPMACTVADCDAILKACKENKVSCSISFSQRPRRCNRKAKELIDQGAIGRILQVQEFSLVPTGLGGLPKWQSDPANLGTLFGHAIHNFDRVRWFTGQEIKTVYAKCGSLTPGAQIEGSSMLLMTMTDGTPVSLWASFEVPKPSFPRSQFTTWILGEKGLIDLDAYGELRVCTGGEWKVAEAQPPIDWAGKGFLDPVRLESYTLQFQTYIDAILADREPPVTGWDGRQAVAAALAAYESSRTGKEILLG